MHRSVVRALACGLAVLLLDTSLVIAGDDAPIKNLPGVSQPAPIVRPLAKPIETPRTNPDGFVRIGEWDVKISGYTRVDIGVGKAAPDKR